MLGQRVLVGLCREGREGKIVSGMRNPEIGTELKKQ
jgi:hypothetical protein